MSTDELLQTAITEQRVLSASELSHVRENFQDLLSFRDRCAEKNTWLLEAIVANQSELVKQLIDLSIQKEQPNQAGAFSLLSCTDDCAFNRNSPLMLAIKLGHSDLASEIIKHLSSEEMNQPDAHGFSPIHMAAILRDDEVLKALIDKAPDAMGLPTESDPQVTAYQLYTSDISEYDLSYPDTYRTNEPSAVDHYFTKNPLYTDLHWHILTICRNYGIPYQGLLQFPQSIIEHCANILRVNPDEVTRQDILSVYQALSWHENPFVRQGLNTFVLWRQQKQPSNQIIDALKQASSQIHSDQLKPYLQDNKLFSEDVLRQADESSRDLHHRPESHQSIAEEAKKQSRAFIIEGSTQLINNSYDPEKNAALYKAVLDLRDVIAEPEMFVLESDNAIQLFQKTVSVCQKYSIGNCYEMAVMALDYCVNHHPEVRTEVYLISGGDHVFLVVGRDPESNPHKPETWGKNAFICDPWANKVYPASHYLSETKNYYGILNPQTGEIKNHLEDLKSGKHTFSPIPNLNSTHLSKMNTKEHVNALINAFEKKYTYLLKGLQNFISGLTAIADRLEEKYGNQDEKYKIILEKKDSLINIVSDLRKNLGNSNKGNSPGQETREALQKKLRDAIRTSDKTIAFSSEDNQKISEYRNPKALKTKLMKFFKWDPTTKRQTQKELEKFQKTLSSIHKVK